MRVARVAAEVAAWSAITFSVWMISLSTAPLQEFLLAAACSIPCGFVAFGARRAAEAAWTVKPRWLRPLLLAPFAIVSDAVQVLSAPVRPGQPGGRFQRVDTGAVGDGPSSRSKRALSTFWVSITPGSYVLDADPETGELLIHSLASRGPRMERHVG